MLVPCDVMAFSAHACYFGLVVFLCLCPSVFGSLVDAMVSLPPVAVDFLDVYLHVIGTSTILSRGCGGIPLVVVRMRTLGECSHWL